jgi:hypothetical protein
MKEKEEASGVTRATLANIGRLPIRGDSLVEVTSRTVQSTVFV